MKPAALPPIAMRAFLKPHEVGALGRASDSTMLSHWIRQQRVREEHVGSERRFDRRAVEELLPYRFEGDELDAARRRLVRLALGELEARGLELIETGLRVPTAAYLDEELLGFVESAQAMTRGQYDAWAIEQGAPESEAIMRRLAVFTWSRLCAQAGLRSDQRSLQTVADS